MVNKAKAATDELWQLFNKAITEQDMEITRKDDQYLKVLQESESKMCKRMELCEKQINELKELMIKAYERDVVMLRNLKTLFQTEKDKIIKEMALSSEHVNETFKPLEKYFSMIK
ncbi:hypothetical protein C9374_008383 [Naegleria lovaniensis]|uniref:Uncharacterized protein n=1 Tax=Naegleria lovaniensis TaxID=51637 RepID=A0AA88GJJ4_NAELO|nr:uncharacterized protein C9374_008383 [Naegleria lovaniensis]KAG2378240.1 hypothetical protein C9374_008383 [Naegleria lovaniensis]